MKNLSKYLLNALLAFEILMVIAGCSYVPEKNLNPDFERQLVKALGLRLVSRDSMYYRSFERVFKDTIVGFHDNHVRNPTDSCYYFFQSLNNLKQVRRVMRPCPTMSLELTSIDDYRNGCVYFGAFGGSFMVGVGADGSRKSYFTNYRNQLFYATKVQLYKNKAILSSFNGIYVFDLKTQQLLWHHNWKQSSSYSTIVNNKLIFEYKAYRDSIHQSSYIEWVNLDDLELVWKREFYNGINFGTGGTLLNRNEAIIHSDNYIAPVGDSLYVVDINTGLNRWLKPNCRFLGIFDKGGFYVSDSTGLTRYSNKDFSKQWFANRVYYYMTVNDKVVTRLKDNTAFMILNKNDGHVISRIKMSSKGNYNLDKLDDYVLINEVSLYK